MSWTKRCRSSDWAEVWAWRLMEGLAGRGAWEGVTFLVGGKDLLVLGSEGRLRRCCWPPLTLLTRRPRGLSSALREERGAERERERGVGREAAEGDRPRREAGVGAWEGE